MENRLKKLILENSSEFNQRFLIYKNRFPSIEVEEFSKYLEKYVLPIVNQNPEESDEIILQFIRTSYSYILELLGKFLLGSKSKFFDFENEFDFFYFSGNKNFLSYADVYFSAIPNSILNLKNDPYFKWSGWKEKFNRSLLISKDRKDIYQSGFILAWMHGKANWRETSLEYLQTISPDFDSLFFSVEIPSEKRKSFIEYLRLNPWKDPMSFFNGKSSKLIVHKRGEFIGLGGNFKKPPKFYSNYSNILTDSEHFYKIHADYFGVSLERIPINDIPPKTKLKVNQMDLTIDLNMIKQNGKLYNLPTFPDSKAEVRSSSDTFYVISPFTFSFLVGGIN